MPSLLMTLDRYPYGCAEQTTSRALPLLYVSELCQGRRHAGGSRPARAASRTPSTACSTTSPRPAASACGRRVPAISGLTAYVTDFLTRAREQNYDVPHQAMVQALSNLQNSLAYDVDLQERGNEIAYALYVLARNHKASISDLRYYADTQIEQFDSPMARAQLAASLALYGDAQRAETIFAAALSLAMDNTRGQLLPLRLRLAAARRRRHAGACRRDQADAGGGAGDDPASSPRHAPRRR